MLHHPHPHSAHYVFPSHSIGWRTYSQFKPEPYHPSLNLYMNSSEFYRSFENINRAGRLPLPLVILVWSVFVLGNAGWILYLFAPNGIVAVIGNILIIALILYFPLRWGIIRRTRTKLFRACHEETLRHAIMFPLTACQFKLQVYQNCCFLSVYYSLVIEGPPIRQELVMRAEQMQPPPRTMRVLTQAAPHHPVAETQLEGQPYQQQIYAPVVPGSMEMQPVRMHMNPGQGMSMNQMAPPPAIAVGIPVRDEWQSVGPSGTIVDANDTPEGYTPPSASSSSPSRPSPPTPQPAQQQPEAAGAPGGAVHLDEVEISEQEGRV